MKQIYLDDFGLEELDQIEMREFDGGKAPSWFGFLGILDAVDDFCSGFSDGFHKR